MATIPEDFLPPIAFHEQHAKQQLFVSRLWLGAGQDFLKSRILP